MVEHLMPIGRGSPGGGNAAGGEQVLRAVRDSVQRPAVLAAADLLLRGPRLAQRRGAHQGHDGVIAAAEPLQAIEAGAGELHRREPPRAEASAELADRKEERAGIEHQAWKVKSGSS